MSKAMKAATDGGTVLAVLATNYGSSYMAGKHHDLRVGFGRKEGEELPLIRDTRVLGSIASGAVYAAGTVMGNDAITEIGKQGVVALGTSVSSTEAIRKRVTEAVQSTAKAPAAASASIPGE